MAAPIKTVAIVVFDGIERLDVEGPLGVLGWAKRLTSDSFSISLLSKDGKPVIDHLNKKQIPVDGTIDATTRTDLLLVPGGGKVDDFINDAELVESIREVGSRSAVLASVCTGAFLVAKANLADGKKMTTHWLAHGRFEQDYPETTLVKDRRVVRDGKLWSSAGVSAGIDMTLRLVAEIWGAPIAKRAQANLEYFPEPPFTRDQVIACLQGAC